MKLHVIPGSPNCRKIIAIISHLNLELDQNVLDIQTGEHKSAAMLALNPNGMTPILEDGDFVLWESNAIAQYLATATTLYPEDARVRADISRWQFWESTHYGKAAGDLVWENFAKQHFGVGNPDAGVVDAALTRYRSFADILDKHLDDRDFMVGELPSIADFCLASHAAYLEPAQIPYREFPNVAAWYDRLDELDAWRAAAPTSP